MKCPKDCICSRCFNPQDGGGRKWNVAHLRGHVIVGHHKVGPTDAMAMTEAIKRAAADAQLWLDEQCLSEEVTPETMRSETKGSS